MKVTPSFTSCVFSITLFLILLSLQPLLCNLPSGGGLQHCLPPDAFAAIQCGPAGVTVEQSLGPNVSSKDNGQQYLGFKAVAHYLNELLDSGVTYSTELLRQSQSRFTLLCSHLAFIMSWIFDELPNSLAMTVASLCSYFPGNLTVLVLPSLYAFSMILFSWMLIYYDSKVPGVYPPSPISPKKLRENSGHTFHLGYTVGLVNGLIVFALSLWSQMSYY